MRNLFRRITVFICSFFWSNNIRPCNPIRFIRKYWAQLALSSIAIQAIANAREIAVTCDMKHLKADSTLTGYICPDGRTRTVEEGEQYNSYR